MHKHGIGFGHFHHVGIDLPVGKVFAAFFVFGFKAHAGPDIGGDQVSPTGGLHRIGEGLEMRCAIQIGAFRLDFVAGWRGDMHIKVQHLGCLQPGIADIVTVAYPGHGFTLYRASVLNKGKNIGQNLTGMVFVGQAVNHRHTRILRETLDNALLKGANHHDVTHA